MSKSPSHFFTPEAAKAYDARNSKLAPLANNMHFLMGLVLNGLPPKAHVLCVGVGTGAEIIPLAKTHTAWTFVGVDPSAAMLEVCAERLKAEGLSNRCRLIHGYVEDAPTEEPFDAALSILVAHFVKRDERAAYFGNMVSRLKKGGTLINTEISADLDSPTFPAMLENWSKVQALMGATPESLATLPQQLRTMLSVLPPDETETLLRQSGITPVRFFQSFLIHGWHGVKG